MSTATVCAGFAAILNGITASVTSPAISMTVTAYDPPPAKLDTAQLPAVYVLTEDADYAPLGSEYYTVTRRYSVRCAVEKTGQSTVENRERRCRPLIDALVARLESYPQIGAVAGVQTMTVQSDSGVLLLPEYDESHIGFFITCEVEETRDRTYLE